MYKHVAREAHDGLSADHPNHAEGHREMLTGDLGWALNLAQRAIQGAATTGPLIHSEPQ
jgi:hypothetical protein